MDDANKKVKNKVKHGLYTAKNSQRLLLQDICNFSRKILDYDFDSAEFHFYMRNLLRKIEQLKVVRNEMGVYKTMNSLIDFLKEENE